MNTHAHTQLWKKLYGGHIQITQGRSPQSLTRNKDTAWICLMNAVQLLPRECWCQPNVYTSTLEQNSIDEKTLMHFIRQKWSKEPWKNNNKCDLITPLLITQHRVMVNNPNCLQNFLQQKFPCCNVSFPSRLYATVRKQEFSGGCEVGSKTTVAQIPQKLETGVVLPLLLF